MRARARLSPTEGNVRFDASVDESVRSVGSGTLAWTGERAVRSGSPDGSSRSAVPDPPPGEASYGPARAERRASPAP